MTRTATPGWKQPKNTYREVTATRIRATDKAILLQIIGISGYVVPKKEATWIPYSQIEKSIYDPHAPVPNWVGMIAEWLLEKNGFLAEESDEEEDPGDNTPEAFDENGPAF